MSANLLFSSGFEGVSVGAPTNGGSQQNILGTDSVTGGKWPPTFWNSNSYLQLLTGVGVTDSTVSNYITNRVETVAGHDGNPTNALFQSINKLGTGVTQDPLLVTPNSTISQQGDLYVSEWIKFQPNLSSQLTSGQMPNGDWGNWRTVFEWKTGGQGADYGGDYRTQLVVREDSSGKLYWSANADNNANGPYTYQNYWQTDNHNIPVKTGEWIHLETFTHRSAGNDGQFWAKVDGQTVVDHTGANIGVDSDPINRIMLSTVYTNGNTPAYQWLDDVQIWDGVPTSAPAPAPAPAPTGGSDVLTVRVAGDAYQGNAQFKVLVDGHQLGDVQTVSASHAAGAWQDVTLTGTLGSAATHKVEIAYLNDLYGGSAGDRNLYVDSISLNGKTYQAETAGTLDPAAGKASAGDVMLWSNGTLAFASVAGDTGTAASAATGSPTSGTTGAPAIGTPEATPTPGGAHTYVTTNAAGTATGTGGADDLYATGAHQTLIGNGGNDIFHVGSYSDTKIVVGGSGITAVSTWGDFTLGDGVDNLAAQGTYAHRLVGNAKANFITGSDGNDTIDGGAGHDTIAVGTGANKLTGGTGQDLFVFGKAADHDNVITDFHLGEDMLDLRGAVKDAGYGGADALADHVLSVTQVGGNVVFAIDPDGNGPGAAHTLVTLQNAQASALKAGADYLWH